MSLVKGPFKLKWGANPTLTDVSEISVDYSVDTNDITTVDGAKHSIQTDMNASVSLTLLSNDVASLAVLLPQYYVPTGGTLSTGEVVTSPQGAIDISAASCASDSVNENLDIYSCESGAQVLRLVNASTRVDSIDFSDMLRQVTIMFTGEPTSGQGLVQFLTDKDAPIS